MKKYIVLMALLAMNGLHAMNDCGAPVASSADNDTDNPPLTPEEQAARYGLPRLSPEEQASFFMEGQKALAEMNNPECNPKLIIAQVEHEQAEQAKLEYDQKIASAKWGRTFVTPTNWYVGISKSDYLGVPLEIADLGADYAFFTQMRKRREAHIIKSLMTLSECEAFIEVLEKYSVDVEKYDSEWEAMDPLQKAMRSVLSSYKKKQATFQKPVVDFIQKHHRLVKGWWPFNKTVILPILARWGWDKFSDWFKENYCHKDMLIPEEHVAADGTRTLSASWSGSNAYYYNAAGELVKSETTPDSITSIFTVFRYLSNPTYMTAKFLGPNYFRSFAKNGNKFLGLIGVPKWLQLPDFMFSNTAQTAFEVMGMGYSAEMFDAILCNEWIQYVFANKGKLLNRLKAYRDAKKDPAGKEDTIEHADQKLHSFVIKAHVSKSWMPGAHLRQWWTSYTVGNQFIPATMNRYILAAVGIRALFAGWQAYKWYKNGGEPAPAASAPGATPAAAAAASAGTTPAASGATG